MKKVGLIAALALATVATPAFAATVVNGSFETPTVGSPEYNPPFEPNGGAFGYAAAPDGNQILHLQGTASYSLDVTGLVAGRNYSASFFAAARPNYLTLPVSVSFGSTVLGTFTPTSTTFTSFGGFNFTATGSTGTLTFTGLNPTPSASNDQNAGIDLVSVTAVPEPATWAMMLMGFGMVGFGLRSRRAKVRTTVSFA